ncbi:unnamed protein product [[Candida] boidinii]|nr:unnamed protein product [[Candida] boidinii]
MGSSHFDKLVEQLLLAETSMHLLVNLEGYIHKSFDYFDKHGFDLSIYDHGLSFGYYCYYYCGDDDGYLKELKKKGLSLNWMWMKKLKWYYCYYLRKYQQCYYL